MNLNRVQLIGYVCNDQYLEITKAGVRVCHLEVATNEPYYKNSERVEYSNLHRVVAYSQAAYENLKDVYKNISDNEP